MASNRASPLLWRQRNDGTAKTNNAPNHTTDQEGPSPPSNKVLLSTSGPPTSSSTSNTTPLQMDSRQSNNHPLQMGSRQSQQRPPSIQSSQLSFAEQQQLQREQEQHARFCEDDRHTQEAYKRNKGRLIESNPYQDLAEFPDESSLFIGDLSRTVSEETLMKIFSECGPVEAVDIKRDKVTKNNLGYGFVKYRDRQVAERAKHRMNGLEIGGRAIRIGWAQKNTNLFVCLVGDTEEQITGEHLKEIFRDFGPIYEEDTFVKRNKYGFVKFKHRAHAERAKAALDGKHLMIPNGYKTLKPVRIGWGDANTQRNCVHVQFEQNSASNADLKEEDFKGQFCKYGVVNKVSLPRYSDKRLKGYGFIHFEENDLGEESAARAITELTASQIKGVVIMCNFGKRQNQRHKRFAQKQKDEMYGDGMGSMGMGSMGGMGTMGSMGGNGGQGQSPMRPRMYNENHDNGQHGGGPNNNHNMGGGGNNFGQNPHGQQYGGRRQYVDQSRNRYMDNNAPQNQNGGDYRNNMDMRGGGNNFNPNGPMNGPMGGNNFNPQGGNSIHGAPNGPRGGGGNHFNGNMNMMDQHNQGQNQFPPPNQHIPMNPMNGMPLNAPPSPQMMGLGAHAHNHNPMMGGPNAHNPMMGNMHTGNHNPMNGGPPLSGPNPFPNPNMFNPMMANINNHNPMMNNHNQNPQITVGQLGVPPSPPPPNNMQSLPPDPKTFQIQKQSSTQSQSESQTQSSVSLPQFGNFPAPTNAPLLDGQISKPGTGPSTPNRIPIGMPNFLPPFAMNPLMNPIGGAMAPQLSPQMGKGATSTSNSPQLIPMQPSPPNLFVAPLPLGGVGLPNLTNMGKFQIPSPNLANFQNLPGFGAMGPGGSAPPSPPISPLMHNMPANLPFIPSPQMMMGNNPNMPPMNLMGNPMLGNGGQMGPPMGGLSGKFGAMNLGNGQSGMGGMHMPMAMQGQGQGQNQGQAQNGGEQGKEQ